MAIRLNVGGHEFLLRADENIDSLKATIVAATDRGGDFVQVAVPDGSEVSILCTRGLPVVLTECTPVASGPSTPTPHAELINSLEFVL
jgi:hypothetical protein